jgi:valyl-tRNA synthetase
MKANIFLLASLLLFTAAVSAQYNGYNNGRYGGMVDHGIPTQSPSKPSQKEIENDRNEKINKVINQLKEDLTLDELQVIAIKNEILTSSKNMEIYMKSETTDEDKLNKFKENQEKLDKTIMSYLNPVQKEKFQKLKEEKAVKKDKKKKNKEQIPD